MSHFTQAVVDITLRPRYAIPSPITPYAADKPHLPRLEIFRILFALAWHTEKYRPLHDVIGD